VAPTPIKRPLKRRGRSRTSRFLPYLYGGLIAVGFLLFDWAGCALLFPDQAPYRYELTKEGPIAEFPELGLAVPETLMIRKFEVRAEQATGPLAVLHTADPGEGAAPVLLEWQSRTAQPLRTVSGRLADLISLAQAVTRHVPETAVVLGWWDTARQLKLLAGVDVLFDENLGQPLLIPPAWSGRRESIEALEDLFWQVSSDSKPLFDRYLDALLSDPGEGAARLRALAGERQAYVAVRLADAYLLGALRPEHFGVGFRDFPAGGEIHGQVTQVKDWLAENGYRSYAVDKKSLGATRVYFLTDAGAEGTLLARMLPFTSSNPVQLEALRLVANYGGYWVYKLPRVEKAISGDAR